MSKRITFSRVVGKIREMLSDEGLLSWVKGDAVPRKYGEAINRHLLILTADRRLTAEQLGHVYLLLRDVIYQAKAVGWHDDQGFGCLDHHRLNCPDCTASPGAMTAIVGEASDTKTPAMSFFGKAAELQQHLTGEGEGKPSDKG